MKQLSIQQLVRVPVAYGATTPNPGGPAVVWSTTTSSVLLWDGSKWGTVINDPELASLIDLNTFGFLVREPGTGNIVTRTLVGTSDQIQIVDSNGVQNPVISLTDTGVTPGTFTKFAVDSQGRIRSATQLLASDIPEDYINLYKENYQEGTAYPAPTGANSIAIGVGAQSLAANSIAIGEQSQARHRGAFVHASGRFQTSGDAQVGRYILKGVTTNNFQKELFLDGPMGTAPLILPDESTWTFTATITAHRTDATDGHAGFQVRGVIYRTFGATSVAFQGTPIVDVISRSNLNWTINTSANSVNGSLSFTVQGESGKTIRWMASIETVEITN